MRALTDDLRSQRQPLVAAKTQEYRALHVDLRRIKSAVNRYVAAQAPSTSMEVQDEAQEGAQGFPLAVAPNMT